VKTGKERGRESCRVESNNRRQPLNGIKAILADRLREEKMKGDQKMLPENDSCPSPNRNGKCR